ncbi:MULTISPECIES: LysR family transcriptional regulator [Actinosynnema]|uniref:LysR family transcriptional regulator n=1 Tax=Actinosynnema TaxID=40566 RepID=UPI0020A4DC23|nr:LysR family transcriptional regulator [Actinosynnema pretiosum]MCP2092335.1 DNA-binding transcriptional regulator, LysR family [Actinosynnema pretiosum]
MDLRQLSCFVAVAEAGNFRRGAARARVPQPTATQLIQRLEREVGHPLFDRATRPVALTAAGGRLLPEARRVLASAREALRVARGECGGSPLPVRVGTAEEMGPRLTDLLLRVRDSHPGLRVELHAEKADDRLRMVRDGELDAAFVRVREEYPGLHLERVWSDELVVALSTANPLTADPALGLARLRDLPLRLPRDVDPLLRRAVVGACEAAGFSPVPGRPFTTGQDGLAELGLDAGAWTVAHPAAARRAEGALVTHRSLTPALVVPVSLATRGEAGDARALTLLAACRDVTPV